MVIKLLGKPNFSSNDQTRYTYLSKQPKVTYIRRSYLQMDRLVNERQMILNKFFKWLYSPDEPNPSERITQPCMQGTKNFYVKKITLQASNLWNVREHTSFLKYCHSKRDRCYRATANDMSARPHEILNLKIKDLIFR